MFNKMRHTSCISCLNNEELVQLRRSEQIDREISSNKRRYLATQKIVLLGAGESGKSTFLKQMQIIHGNGFSFEERLAYRTQIYENILRAMAGLTNGRRELQIPWYGTKDPLSGSLLGPTSMRIMLKRFSRVYQQLVDERAKEEARTHKRVHIKPAQFSQAAVLIYTLWNDRAIQETFERKRELPRYFVENMPYFMDRLYKLTDSDYLPDTNDILKCRRATTGIAELNLDIKNVPFHFIDVGGQRTQRQKWHMCLSDVTAILFMASCSDYDELLREDSQTNRLDESCKVFETLINYKYLQSVEFILFLNKHDLLREKLARKVNIKHYFADFIGNPFSLSDVETYFVCKFATLKKVDRYHECLRKEDEAKTCIANYSVPFYFHFTTATDTSNIKTIFDMVRCIIFERNYRAIMLN